MKSGGMKSDRVFLLHILDEIDFPLQETKGQSVEEFIKNELTKRAYSKSLEVIGESVKNLC